MSSTIVQTRGRSFFVEVEPIFFTEEIVGFKVVSYRELSKDHPFQKIMRQVIPAEPSLFPEDEINSLRKL